TQANPEGFPLRCRFSVPSASALRFQLLHDGAVVLGRDLVQGLDLGPLEESLTICTDFLDQSLDFGALLLADSLRAAGLASVVVLAAARDVEQSERRVALPIGNAASAGLDRVLAARGIGRQADCRFLAVPVSVAQDARHGDIVAVLADTEAQGEPVLRENRLDGVVNVLPKRVAALNLVVDLDLAALSNHRQLRL